MKSLKKILGIVLCVLMLASALSLNCFAIESDGLIIESNGDGYKIVDANASVRGDVVIPDEIGGKKVVEIGEGAFANMLGITSVTIGKNISIVNKNAFNECINLACVEFADSELSVKIRERAFFDCEKLASVKLPKNITTIPKNCFENCYALNDIEIPASVTTISDESFIHCTSLESVEIPVAVNFIGARAFMNCPKITSFSVKSGSESFKSVNDVLFTLDGKELVQYPIGKSAESYSVPAGTEIIRKGAFSFGKVSKIILPDSIMIIDEKGFSDNKNLSDINLPEGLEEICLNAFLNCTALKKITIPSTIQSFENAFVGSGLEEVIISSGIKEISAYAFNDCKNLSKVTIPETVEEIGVCAFEKCTSLKELNIPSSVKAIGNDAFSGCKDLTILAEEGSFAAQYANENGLSVKDPDTEEDVNWFVKLIRAIAGFFKSLFQAIASLFSA